MPHNSETAERELSDQEILDPVWSGRKTGNLFKATAVTLEDGERQVTYRRASGQAYKIPYASFIRRFRHATVDELWTHVKTAEMIQQDGETSDVVTVIEPDLRHDLDRIVLYPECRNEIRIGLNLIQRREDLEKAWSLSQIEPRSNRVAMNFYGDPGTGKTLSAVAVAKLLDKKLLKVDYAEVVSKFVGDTAKHIKEVFRVAKEQDAAILWDEADSLLSKRLAFGDSSDGASVTSINQNRNVLLNQLDEFNGIVIFSTNFFGNFDEAFLRRIARHVEFKMPNVSMRKQLFELHLPNRSHVQFSTVEWEEVANASEHMSGGDILNVVVNAIARASMPDKTSDWELTAEDLLEEVRIIKCMKKKHAEANGRGPKVALN